MSLYLFQVYLPEIAVCYVSHFQDSSLKRHHSCSVQHLVSHVLSVFAVCPLHANMWTVWLSVRCLPDNSSSVSTPPSPLYREKMSVSGSPSLWRTLGPSGSPPAPSPAASPAATWRQQDNRLRAWTTFIYPVSCLVHIKHCNKRNRQSAFLFLCDTSRKFSPPLQPTLKYLNSYLMDAMFAWDVYVDG